MGKPCSTQPSLDMADAYLTWHANALVALSLASMVGNGIKSVVSYWKLNWKPNILPSSCEQRQPPATRLAAIVVYIYAWWLLPFHSATHTVAEGITRKLLSIVVDVRYRNLLPTLPVSVHVFILERFLSSLYSICASAWAVCCVRTDGGAAADGNRSSGLFCFCVCLVRSSVVYAKPTQHSLRSATTTTSLPLDWITAGAPCDTLLCVSFFIFPPSLFE